MPRNRSSSPAVAAVLSLLVPGLGQIYAGKQERGAAILVAGIVVGTLSLIWQTLFVSARMDIYPFWAYRILLVAYTLVFWIWQVADAYRQAE